MPLAPKREALFSKQVLWAIIVTLLVVAGTFTVLSLMATSAQADVVEAPPAKVIHPSPIAAKKAGSPAVKTISVEDVVVDRVDTTVIDMGGTRTVVTVEDPLNDGDEAIPLTKEWMAMLVKFNASRPCMVLVGEPDTWREKTFKKMVSNTNCTVFVVGQEPMTKITASVEQ